MQGNAANWVHCGDSRLYVVRGDKLITRTRDHSYSELQETPSQVVPVGERINRNILFTCLGSPTKPVFDTAGPAAAAAARPHPAVLRRPVGQPQRRVIIVHLAARPSPTPCPTWWSWRCATAARRATTSP